MWKAKENILWFKKGELVEKIQDNWKPHFIEVKEDSKEVKVEAKVKPKKKRLFSKKKE